MIKRILFILFFFFTQTAFAQFPVFEWAKEFLPISGSSEARMEGSEIAVDKDGNVYTAGFFVGTVDLDPGPSVFNLSAPVDETSIYISKLDAQGNFVWAKAVHSNIRSIRSLGTESFKMDVDVQGNVFLTGQLHRPTDLDPGSASYMLVPKGDRDVYLVKLDKDGNFIWVKQFGGPGANVLPGTIHIDRFGNIITTGGFSSMVDFDPGVNLKYLSARFSFESYLIKLTNDGDLIWMNKIGDYENPGELIIRGITTDATGTIFVSGNFSGKPDFDPSAASRTIVGNLLDGFVANYSKDGNFNWVKHLSESVGEYIKHINLRLDKNGFIYLTGSFLGSPDFDPGPGEYVLTSSDANSPFLAKLTNQGDFVWAKKNPIIGKGEGYGLTIDTAGFIYAISSALYNVDFGMVPGDAKFDFAKGEAMLCKFNPTGDLLYAIAFLQKDGEGMMKSITSDLSSNLYVTGYPNGVIDLDPSEDVFYSTKSFSWVPAIIKLARCQQKTYSSISISQCKEYTLNGITYTESGRYNQTIQNAAGCDSIITLNLSIKKSTDTIISISTCKDYTFHGKTLIQSGTYYDTLVNAAGCDSTITLNLQVLRTSTTQTKTICEGEYFLSRGIKQTQSGVYIDTLVSAAGCDSIVSTTLVVYPKPTPNLGVAKRFCEGTSAYLTPGIFSSYFWNDESTDDTLFIQTAGRYVVTVSNTYGCFASDTIDIPALYPKPSQFLKPMDSICDYGKLTLSSLFSYKEYLWFDGSVQSQTEISSPGSYSLQVKDVNGCIGKDTIQVFLKQCMKGVYIPNAFTPNGDKVNDSFKALVFGDPVYFKLQVFNQWGEEIFMTTDPKKGWNGIYKDMADKTQNYVWLCRYQLKNEPPVVKKGTVVLIR